MKKALFVSICIFTAVSGVFAYSGGVGSVADPYQISSVADLSQLIATPADNGKSFVVTEDIDMTSAGNDFVIGGTFSGTFDGDGNTIMINWSGAREQYVALFQDVTGTVKDLDVEANFDFYQISEADQGFAAGIACYNDGTITNCTVSGQIYSVDTYFAIGGVVGENNGTVSACNADVNINSNASCYVGGIVAQSTGTVSGCAFGGNIYIYDEAQYSQVAVLDAESASIAGSFFNHESGIYTIVGGAVGYAITGSTTIGVMCGTEIYVDAYNAYVGGVVGYLEGAATNCVSTSSSISTAYSTNVLTKLGGVVGWADNGSTVTSCSFANGDLTGGNSTDMGGVVGYSDAAAVSKSYASGTMTVYGKDYAGGIVGNNSDGSVINCYNAMDISVADNVFGKNVVVGGIVGLNAQENPTTGAASVQYCHNVGAITDPTESETNWLATIVGWNDNGTISNVYYDNMKSVASDFVNYGDATVTASLALTTTQMSTQASFTGWDFATVWYLPAGNEYPVFKPSFVGYPYQISSLVDLINLGDSPWLYDADFVVTQDINLTGYVFDWSVIARPSSVTTDYSYNGTAFSGTFDGQGYSLTGLTIDTSANPGRSYIGLFGQLSSTAVVSNVMLNDVMIDGRNSRYVGAIAGENRGSVSKCGVEGNVDAGNSSMYAGGVVGRSFTGSTIANCYFEAYGMLGVAANVYAGGIVGDAYRCAVSNCYVVSTVVDANYAGPISGRSYIASTSSCYWDVTNVVDGDENIFDLADDYTGRSVIATVDANTGPKSVSQMQTQSTFVGWDFATIWTMPVGDYPELN